MPFFTDASANTQCFPISDFSGPVFHNNWYTHIKEVFSVDLLFPVPFPKVYPAFA